MHEIVTIRGQVSRKCDEIGSFREMENAIISTNMPLNLTTEMKSGYNCDLIHFCIHTSVRCVEAQMCESHRRCSNCVNCFVNARTNRARIAFPELAYFAWKMPQKEPVKNFLFLRTNSEGIGLFGNWELYCANLAHACENWSTRNVSHKSSARNRARYFWCRCDFAA